MTSNAHKPSEKHTLDEVLKSLQDLMRGELLQDAPKPPPPPKPHYGKVGRPRKVPKPPTETTAPPTPLATAGPVDVGAVLASLRSLVSHELAPEEGVAPGGAVSGAAADAELPNVSAALAQADEALSVLADTAQPSTMEPTGETTEFAVSASPAPASAAAPEEVIDDVAALASVPVSETAAAPAPQAESSIPPEGLQQEFAFGAVEAEPVSTEILTLELSPTEPAAPDTAPTSEPEILLSGLPAQELEIVQSIDDVPVPPDVNVPESFDDALAVPADEPQVAVPETEGMEAEEIVLEALPPPADEPGLETTVELTVGNDDSAAPATPTLAVVELALGETAGASTAVEPSIEFETQPLTPPEVSIEETPASPAVDTELLDGPSAPTESAPPEIEVTEAPGNSIEFERSEPPTATAPTDEPALGTLGGHLEVDLGDLPVLQDVVVPPPAAAQLNLIEPPLPSADRARELAVRVAAKINIERRKRGEPGIDTKTIHRLQQLLREELEKAGAKGENTPKS